MHNAFRYFNSSPEVIRLTMMLYVRCPLSLRQIDDLLFERNTGRIALARYSQPRSGHAAFIINPFELALASGRSVRPHQRRDT